MVCYVPVIYSSWVGQELRLKTGVRDGKIIKVLLTPSTSGQLSLLFKILSHFLGVF